MEQTNSNQKNGWALVVVVWLVVVAKVVDIAGGDNAKLYNYQPQTPTKTSQNSTKESRSEWKSYPKREFKPLRIELNTADTTELKKVYGIGSVFAKRIVDYRQRLGGYIKIEQLREVKGINEEVFERVYKNFIIDSLKVSKIDINFADQNSLSGHPYIGANMARRIARATQMKGGYQSEQELVTKNILLPHEARKLAPYLRFR